MRVIENGVAHEFEEMTPDKRPQDPHGDGSGLTFQTLEHGGEYPDAMPQAILLTDAEGRSCIYVPVRVEGRVVDSGGFTVVSGLKEDSTSRAEKTRPGCSFR